MSPINAGSEEPREVLSGEGAAGPFAQVQAYLAIGAALTGALGAILPHPDYFNVTGLLAVQACSLGYGLFVLALQNRISFAFLRIGNLCAAVLTTFAVYFSGDSAGAYAIFYLWIGFYVFYYPVSRTQAAVNIGWGVANYAIAIAITSTPPAAASNLDVAFFAIVSGTLITAGVLLSYLRQRVDKLMGRLVEASRTDPLTGLPNRVALHQALARELERARPEQRPVSVIVVDMDGFKAFNARFGIAAADSALQEVGALIVDTVRMIDTVSRSGGEEFTVILPETDRHQAFLIAEELLAKTRDLEGGRDELTASAGLATFPSHGEDLAALISSADKALHAAKMLGRDRAVIYSPEVTGTLGEVAGRRNVEAQAHLSTVLSLAEALDQRDTGTAAHSQTVGQLCETMANELGLPPDRVQRIRLAGVLHDIGKIGVPDSILRKPGPLTEEERDQMRRHPELGGKILSTSELDDVREWIVAHHERPDGTGYPAGLTADEIPLESSILAVADAYEAMISDRVYRLGIGSDAARRELIDHSGTQFNPDVVKALLRALDRNPELVSV